MLLSSVCSVSSPCCSWLLHRQPAAVSNRLGLPCLKSHRWKRMVLPILRRYQRPAIPEDYAPGGRPALPQLELPATIFPTAFVRDVVVSNTNPNLVNTDTANDGEPSIAVDPNNTSRIVISAFSGSWGANAPLWESNDGGSTWTEQSTIPVPPGLPSATTSGCPCDQAFDYDRSNRVFGHISEQRRSV